MKSVILKRARLSDWSLVLLTVVLSEILTLLFSSIQGLIIWGHVPEDLILIGAVDAFLVSMPLAYAIILIVRSSARIHMEKRELEKEVDERMRIEEGLQHSLQQLQMVADNVDDVFWTMDLSCAFKYVSPSVERMFGYTPEEALGKSLKEILSPESIKIPLRSFKERLKREEAGDPDNAGKRHELIYLRKDGSTFWAEVTSSPMRDGEGRLKGFLGVTRNIQDRKLAEEKLQKSQDQLRSSLRQKEILLQEVHHRVRNNLAIISALLSLQARNSNGLKEEVFFRESQSRIHAMAYVHEQLYMHDDMETIDFKSYVEGLTYYLQHAYMRGDGDIRLSTHIGSVFLGIDTLIPCGLILNELITNAFKYAATDSDTPLELRIDLDINEEGLVTLEVSDNGPGLPDDIETTMENSLGMRIVNQLVAQLQGEMKVSNTGGARFSISFPLKEVHS